MIQATRKDALARTVRLLTRKGTEVTFRGATPFVAADRSTGKVMRLNMPEIPDEPSQQLIDALQGYLDHECGHIFYTPFDRIPGDYKRDRLANIFEDIRLEKLLPADLPGTRDNLERMYVNWIPLIIQPNIDAAIKSGDDARIMSALLVPMMRAMGGQQVFVDLMSRYWSHVDQLRRRLPGFDAQIQAMQTYDDVLACVDVLERAMTPPPPPPAPPAPPPQPEPEPEPDVQEQGDPDQKGQSDNDDDEGADAGDGEPQDDGEDDVGDEASDEPEGPGGDDAGNSEPDDSDCGGDSGDSSDDDDADNGESHEASGGDAGDDDEPADGDDASDPDGEDGEPDEGGGDEAPEPGKGRGGQDRDDADDTDDVEPGEDGERNRTMSEALGLLDPTLRRALYLHKRRDKSIDEIAGEMNVSTDRAAEMLREARRGLADLMRS